MSFNLYDKVRLNPDNRFHHFNSQRTEGYDSGTIIEQVTDANGRVTYTIEWENIYYQTKVIHRDYEADELIFISNNSNYNLYCRCSSPEIVKTTAKIFIVNKEDLYFYCRNCHKEKV